MRTEAQQAASRANGAKSHGPTTPEGKAISSRNALTHGIYSRDRALLRTEQVEEFDTFVSDFKIHYQPVNIVETQIVCEMALTQWRRMRAETVETSLLDVTMDRMAPEVDKDFQDIGPCARGALAYERLHQSGRAPQDLAREIARLSRQFLNLERALWQMRNRGRENAKLEIEPKAPASGGSGANEQ